MPAVHAEKDGSGITCVAQLELQTLNVCGLHFAACQRGPPVRQPVSGWAPPTASAAGTSQTTQQTCEWEAVQDSEAGVPSRWRLRDCADHPPKALHRQLPVACASHKRPDPCHGTLVEATGARRDSVRTSSATRDRQPPRRPRPPLRHSHADATAEAATRHTSLDSHPTSDHILV
jgi:hypothetical protein